MEGKRKRNISKYNLSPAMELVLQQEIQKWRERMIGLKKKGCQDTKSSETSQIKTASNQEENQRVSLERSLSAVDQDVFGECRKILDSHESRKVSLDGSVAADLPLQINLEDFEDSDEDQEESQKFYSNAVSVREEELKYQEVKQNQKKDKIPTEESPASPFPAFYYSLPEESSPLHGQQSSKVSSPERSDVCENLQLHSDLNLEPGRGESSGEKPEVKKSRMTEGELHCKKCLKVFNTDWELVLHYEADHLQNNYKCDVCGVAVFKYAARLRAHQRECQRKVEAMPFTGEREFSTFQENTIQSQLHQIAPAAGNKFPCNMCPKIFNQIYTLKEHKEVKHFGRRYFCRFCYKQFSNRPYFRHHEKACEQNKMAN